MPPRELEPLIADHRLGAIATTAPPATTRIDEIVDGIYWISSWTPDLGITFDQFLIDDERPALIHTGEHYRYDAVHKAIGEVLDPATLEFVALLHFESDGCGGWVGSWPRRPRPPWPAARSPRS